MYFLLVLLVPILYIFSPLLGFGGLVLAIVWMVYSRLRAAKRPPKRRREEESEYEAGYR